MTVTGSELSLWAETLANIEAAEKAANDARLSANAERGNADKEQEYRNAREALKDELYCHSHIIVDVLRKATEGAESGTVKK